MNANTDLPSAVRDAIVRIRGYVSQVRARRDDPASVDFFALQTGDELDRLERTLAASCRAPSSLPS